MRRRAMYDPYVPGLCTAPSRDVVFDFWKRKKPLIFQGLLYSVGGESPIRTGDLRIMILWVMSFIWFYLCSYLFIYLYKSIY